MSCCSRELMEVSPEEELCWRMDALKLRLDELADNHLSYENSYVFMEDDLRYALPEHLNSVRQLREAIELVEADLMHKHGIIAEWNIYEKGTITFFILPKNIYQVT